jgi:hypothetical protein
MSNLLRKGSMLATMVLASGSMMLAAAPSYAGNEIEIQALGDVVPACDILGQTVGRLVESVPGDGTDGFTRGRLISAPDDANGGGARGELAIVGLSCNANGDTIATITSPVKISGPDLDINVATTRAYIAGTFVPAGTPVLDENDDPVLDENDDPVVTAADTFSNFLQVLTGRAPGFQQLPLMAVTSDVRQAGAVKVSDAVLLTGTGSAVGGGDITLGIGFEVEVNGPRIPSGQFGFATTLSVVPR